MRVYQDTLRIETRGKRTIEITADIAEIIRASKVKLGTVNVHCLHTSCSLVLMENADPSARDDLEAFMERLVPENLAYFTHTYEGPDDMPSHIKMALTRSNETLPITNAHLNVGTWQGVFLWEHRAMQHSRRIVVTVMGE